MTVTFEHAPGLRVELVDLNPDDYYRDPRPFLRQNQVITALRKKTPPPIKRTPARTYAAPSRSGWNPHFAYTGTRKGDKELLAKLATGGVS